MWIWTKASRTAGALMLRLTKTCVGVTAGSFSEPNNPIERLKKAARRNVTFVGRTRVSWCVITHLFHTGFLRHAADEVRVDEPVRLSALGFLESCQMRTAMCAHLWSPAERPCGRTAVILSESQFRSKYEKTLTRPASADTTAGQQKREAGSNPHLTGKVRTGASPRRRRLVRCFGFCVVVPLTFSAR